MGLCPFCLLQLGLEAPTTIPAPWLDLEESSFQVLNVLRVEGGTTSYLAEQETPTQRLVVLTTLGTLAPGDRARVEDTLRVLVEFEHSLVERVYGGIASGSGELYLVTEFVPGTPLAEHCARVGADHRERASLCLSVVEAICAAHKRGVVHGKLTPSSVVVATRRGVLAPIVTRLGAALAAQDRPRASGDAEALAELARLLGLAVPVRLPGSAEALADALAVLAR